MNTGKTLFAQLMDFLPWTTFTRIVDRYGGDHRVRTLSCAEQYRSMAFAQLTYRESLRDIETCLSVHASKLYHMGFRQPVRRSTLADANERRDWRIHAALAQRLITLYSRTLYDGYLKDSGLDLANTVYALDHRRPSICACRYFPNSATAARTNAADKGGRDAARGCGGNKPAKFYPKGCRMASGGPSSCTARCSLPVSKNHVQRGPSATSTGARAIMCCDASRSTTAKSSTISWMGTTRLWVCGRISAYRSAEIEASLDRQKGLRSRIHRKGRLQQAAERLREKLLQRTRFVGSRVRVKTHGLRGTRANGMDASGTPPDVRRSTEAVGRWTSRGQDGIKAAKFGSEQALHRQTSEGREMKTSRTGLPSGWIRRSGSFQLHWVDMETGEIVDLKLTRAKFLEHFANRVPCVVAMEACGGSQHWARRLRELGHDPWLLPAKAVRPFVSGNKNDAHDARAIWTAAQMPSVRTVAVKSEEQQAILALHRMRQQLVKFRTAQINGLRGLLTEYGEVMPRGRAGMRRGMAEALERISERLPAVVHRHALASNGLPPVSPALDAGRCQREARLADPCGVWHQRLITDSRGRCTSTKIPGVGVLTATAVVRRDGRSRRPSGQ